MTTQKFSINRSEASPISHHVIRMHNRLLLSADGPAVPSKGPIRTQPIHLQQSELDSACGHHCLLAALMLLGVLSWREIIRTTEGESRGRHKRFWQLAREHYFSGTTVTDLKRALQPIATELVTRVCHRSSSAALRDFVLAHLALDWPVLLRISNRRKGFDHWVLAVGIMGRHSHTEFVAEHILLLDPSYPAVPLAGWNELLAVKMTKGTRRYRLLNALGKICDVTLESALAVRRA